MLGESESGSAVFVALLCDHHEGPRPSGRSGTRLLSCPGTWLPPLSTDGEDHTRPRPPCAALAHAVEHVERLQIIPWRLSILSRSLHDSRFAPGLQIVWAEQAQRRRRNYGFAGRVDERSSICTSMPSGLASWGCLTYAPGASSDKPPGRALDPCAAPPPLLL